MSDPIEPRALADFEWAAHMLALICASPPTRGKRPPWWRPLARRRVEREYVDDLDCWADGAMIMGEDLFEAEHALELARDRDRLREAIE